MRRADVGRLAAVHEAVDDLVADGHLLRRGALPAQPLQIVGGEVVHGLGQVRELQLGPGAWFGLLARVRPGVRVVEVDTQAHAPLLDPLRRDQ